MTTGTGSTLLVLGAQGFLGRHVVSQWLAADHQNRVVAVGRSPQSATHFTQTVVVGGRDQLMPLPPQLMTSPEDAHRITYVSADAAAAPSIDAVIADHPVDAVVHVAAALRDDPLPALLGANVLSVVHLTRALTKERPGIRLVLVSSGSVNWRSAASDEQPNPYTATKAAGELVVASAADLDPVVARVHNLVGAGLHHRHLPARVALELGERSLALEHSADAVMRPLQTGSLSAARDLIDVADAARAVLASVLTPRVHLPAPGPLPVPLVEIGTGRSRSMREVVAMQIAAAGLSGKVQIAEDPRHGGGPSNLVADPASMLDLGVPAKTPFTESLRAMAVYARNQLLDTGTLDN